MGDEEVIQENMEQTRQALASKLETLESKVAGTVQTVTDTIQETVQTVSDTVEKTKEAVSSTVETVTDTVAGAVENVTEGVKHALDVSGHVRHHPWLMFGGSMLVGFLAGRLLGGRSRREETAERAVPSPTAYLPNGSREHPRFEFDHNGHRYEAVEEERADEGPSLLENVVQHLAPLKELAVGATLGVAREMLARHMPDNLKQGLVEVMDDMTTSLGGKPIKSSEGPPDDPSSRSAA